MTKRSTTSAKTVRAPAALTHSVGSIRLRAIPERQTEIAARLGIDRSLVSRMGSGKANPTPSQKRILSAEFGIPTSAWEEAPSPPTEPDWSKVPPLSQLTFEHQTLALYEDVVRLRAKAADYEKQGDIKTHLRIIKETTAAQALLGKLLGTTLEITEERAMRIPAVRKMLTRIAEALRAHPDAYRAVFALSKTIERVERGETG